MLDAVAALRKKFHKASCFPREEENAYIAGHDAPDLGQAVL